MNKKKFEKGVGYIPSWHINHPSTQINQYFDKGIPSGTIMQIQSSGEGSWKSSVALQLAGEVQKQGHNVAYVDAENAVVWEEAEDGTHRCQWFEQLGVDSSEIFYVKNDFQEQLFEDIKELIREYNVKFVIIDSIPSLEPEKVHNQKAGESAMGLRAKINTKELVKLTGICKEHDATICGINHKKAVITDMGSFGETAVGGKSWKFYSQLIMVHSRTTSKSTLEGNNIIDLKVYIEKNKFGKQFVECRVKAEQGYGIVEEPDLLEEALKQDVMKKGGAGWFYVADESEEDGWQSVAQGSENVIYWLRENKSEVKQMLNEKE